MCYKKPGPRCSAHAARALIAARVKWDRAVTDDERTRAMATLKEAREQYDTTPVGQMHLNDAIRWGRDSDGLLSARLEHGIAKRKQMLESIGTKDSGYIDDNTLPKFSEACYSNNMNSHRELILPDIPMKDLDGTLLTLAIQKETARMSQELQHLINEAIVMAAYLHRADTRKNATRSTSGEIKQPTSPYIEHPLRNTLRLIRWGVGDSPVIIASLLHDTVEDHAADIVAEFTSVDESQLSEAGVRIVAFDHIGRVFGEDVAGLVKAVSNPITNVRDVPRVERNAEYVQHVYDEINGNPKAFLVKFSDFVDNALSLHHYPADKLTKSRVEKYYPLVEVFRKTYNLQVAQILSANGANDITVLIERADSYLRSIVNSSAT